MGKTHKRDNVVRKFLRQKVVNTFQEKTSAKPYFRKASYRSKLALVSKEG